MSTCILSIVSRESLKVFASILRRMTSFDSCLEILEAFNRGGLDRLDELEPNNVECVVILSFLFDFAHESGIQREKEELDGGEIFRFVVLL
jgi:hypothetical protein